MENLVKKMSVEKINEFKNDAHEYITGDYIRRHLGTTIVYGWGDVFGDYRLFVESPDFDTNETGKWTLVCYDKDFKELKREIVGGAERVGSWDKVAALALEWIDGICEGLMIDAGISRLDVDWWELDDEHADDIQAETDDMYEYAAEAHDAIEDIVVGIEEDYNNIDYELNHTSETDWDWVKELVEGVYEKLTNIHNELGWCLHRCDERTGCDIHWDDFCGTGYFEDIKLPEGYSVTDFIDVFDNDEKDFMEHIMCCLWRSLDGENKDALRDMVNDNDLGFNIAA